MSNVIHSGSSPKPLIFQNIKAKIKAVCIFHPKYDGIAVPLLTCKTCCKLYTTNVKAATKAKAKTKAKS